MPSDIENDGSASSDQDLEDLRVRDNGKVDLQEATAWIQRKLESYPNAYDLLDYTAEESGLHVCGCEQRNRNPLKPVALDSWRGHGSHGGET